MFGIPPVTQSTPQENGDFNRGCEISQTEFYTFD